MDLGWVVTVASPTNSSAQVTIISNDDPAAPGISVEVADVDAVHTKAVEKGLEIAYPLRAIFKRDGNVRILLAEVADFDLDARELHLRSVSAVPAPERLGYDTLIVAGGSHYSYFGHDEWREPAARMR